MIDRRDVGQLLRGAFGGNTPDLGIEALAAQADAAIAAVATQPGLHPAMAATLAGLYGADSVDRLQAAMTRAADELREPQEPHGAGHELIVEYDLEEQARFEAACGREEAGWPED